MSADHNSCSGKEIWLLICNNAVVQILWDSPSNPQFAVMEETSSAIGAMFNGAIHWRKFGENTYGLFEGERSTSWTMQRVSLP